MFDIWYGDIELTTLVMIISTVSVMPLQIFLCFKVKSVSRRLIPAAVLSLLTGMFVLLGFVSIGLRSIGYYFFAIFSFIMLLACGTGWAVWFVISRIRKK